MAIPGVRQYFMIKIPAKETLEECRGDPSAFALRAMPDKSADKLVFDLHTMKSKSVLSGVR